MAPRDDHPELRSGVPSMQYSSAASPQVLGESLARLARELQRENSSQAVMDRVVQAAVALVPGAQEGTISLVRAHKDIHSEAATSGLGRRWDELQNETGQGPCLDAMFEQKTMRVADLRRETRWPALTARCAEVGLLSMACFQLFVDGDNLGALNLLSAEADAFDDDSEDVGLLFAAHAAVALAAASRLHHVQLALDGRDVIGQAKGILMERFKITADEAFVLLARVSQDSNRKLREVAVELTDTGHLRR